MRSRGSGWSAILVADMTDSFQHLLRACWNIWLWHRWDYLTNRSGCAKKSAYISNKDLLSRMKVGRTTYETQRRHKNEKLQLRETKTKVKSREKKIIDKAKGKTGRRRVPIYPASWKVWILLVLLFLKKKKTCCAIVSCSNITELWENLFALKRTHYSRVNMENDIIFNSNLILPLKLQDGGALSGVYLCEVHTQTNLRKQMHDDAFVLLHRLAFGVIIPVIVAIKQLWNQHQNSVKRLQQRRFQCGGKICMLYFSTCICGAVGHGWVERLCGVWSFQSSFFII